MPRFKQSRHAPPTCNSYVGLESYCREPQSTTETSHCEQEGLKANFRRVIGAPTCVRVCNRKFFMWDGKKFDDGMAPEHPGRGAAYHCLLIMCKRSITLMSSLLLLVVLQQAGRSAVMGDCENKEGSKLWPSRHLAGKREDVGRRKLSEDAGMLGSMLQRGEFPTPRGKKKKLVTWYVDVQEEGMTFKARAQT